VSDTICICKLLFIAFFVVGCGVDITFDDRNRGLLEAYDPDAGFLEDASAVDASGMLTTLDHSAWAGVLTAHHRGDCFDYDGLSASSEARALLGQYLDQLSRVQLDGLDGQDRLALWINAYNAITVQGVVDARMSDPQFRVDANGFAFFQVRSATVGGLVVSLDALEHGIVRGEVGRDSLSGFDATEKDQFLAEHAALGPFDPRVHFALNCASRSCPGLRGEPFRGESLDTQLDHQASLFMDDPLKGAGPAGISALFTWFRTDFEQVAPIPDYIAMYRMQGLDGVNTEVSLEYIWALNDFDAQTGSCR